MGAVLFLYATVQNAGADRSVLMIGCGPPSKSEIGFQIIVGRGERVKTAYVFGLIVRRRRNVVTSNLSEVKLVGRVTPCAPQCGFGCPNGAHGVMRPTGMRYLCPDSSGNSNPSRCATSAQPFGKRGRKGLGKRLFEISFHGPPSPS